MTDSLESNHDLGRFIDAQEGVYEQVLAELLSGRKQSHWMWFIFPQVAGLGFSSTSRYYAIKSLAEARAYLADPVLGARLLQCTEVLMAIEKRSALDIFGAIDELKFKSSMTLFAQPAGPESIYQQALGKYFTGESDRRTLDLLGLSQALPNSSRHPH